MADEAVGTTETEAAESNVAATAEATATGTTEATSAVQAAETFTNPNDLPAELQPIYKRMQASYTRKMQALSQDRNELRSESENYRRLMNDPEYARQVILESAERLGLQVQPKGGGNGNGHAAATPSAGGAPADLVKTVESRLAPEMKWMARDLADAAWIANQAALQPVIQRQNLDARERRGEQYEALAAELSAKVPDWQEHEDEMAQILNFLSSDQLTHPVYGSKVEMLYNMATKNTAATREAVRRVTNAARNRTVTGRAETSTTPNLAEAVKKAPTMQDAWKIAAQAAAEKVGVQL